MRLKFVSHKFIRSGVLILVGQFASFAAEPPQSGQELTTFGVMHEVIGQGQSVDSPEKVNPSESGFSGCRRQPTHDHTYRVVGCFEGRPNQDSDPRRTRLSSEREPADSLRDQSNVNGD